MTQPALVPELLNHPLIWRGASAVAARQAPVIATGYAALDRELPDGGWPAAGLSELLCDAVGAGEVSLLLPALAACAPAAWATTDARKRDLHAGRGIVWIAPPYLPYAPALAAAGVDLKRLLIVRPATPADAWWAAEQAMRSGAAAMVVLWTGLQRAFTPSSADEFHSAKHARSSYAAQPEYTMLRRLQLACSGAQCAGFVYRTSNAAQQTSPAPLRVALKCASSATEDRLELRILKRRGLHAAQPLYLQRGLRAAHLFSSAPASEALQRASAQAL